MAAIPWMPLYVSDYLADTGHLGTIEHGAYFLMMMHYWTKGPLPDDEGQLRKIARMTPREWSEARGVLLDMFFHDAEVGVYRHKRIDAELAVAEKMIDAKSKAGTEGAKKRWQTHGSRIRKQNAGANGSNMAEPLPVPMTEPCERTAPLPSPVPVPEERTNLGLPGEGSDVLTFCEALGVNFRSDQSRIHWPALLHEAQAKGLDFKTHILPAALETRARGKTSIEYALKVARSKRDAQATAPPPVAPLIELADDRGWETRMKLFHETGTWLPKWGPKWGETGCLCPGDIYVGDIPSSLRRVATNGPNP